MNNERASKLLKMNSALQSHLVAMNVFHFHPWEAWLRGEKQEYGNLQIKAFICNRDNTCL